MSAEAKSCNSPKIQICSTCWDERAFFDDGALVDSSIPRFLIGRESSLRRSQKKFVSKIYATIQDKKNDCFKMTVVDDRDNSPLTTGRADFFVSVVPLLAFIILTHRKHTLIEYSIRRHIQLLSIAPTFRKHHLHSQYSTSVEWLSTSWWAIKMTTTTAIGGEKAVRIKMRRREVMRTILIVMVHAFGMLTVM
jgi:hypothetical protein